MRGQVAFPYTLHELEIELAVLAWRNGDAVRSCTQRVFLTDKGFSPIRAVERPSL